MKKIALTLLSLVILTACSPQEANKQDENSVITDKTTTEQTLTESTITTENKTVATTDSQTEGSQRYFIKAITDQDGKTFAEIDKVRWLSGVVSKIDKCYGPENPSAPQCNPNNFLILNESSETEEFEISPTATIQKIVGSDPAPSNLDELKTALSSTNGFDVTPFFITVENNTITSIEQKYIP